MSHGRDHKATDCPHCQPPRSIEDFEQDKGTTLQAFQVKSFLVEHSVRCYTGAGNSPASMVMVHFQGTPNGGSTAKQATWYFLGASHDHLAKPSFDGTTNRIAAYEPLSELPNFLSTLYASPRLSCYFSDTPSMANVAAWVVGGRDLK